MCGCARVLAQSFTLWRGDQIGGHDVADFDAAVRNEVHITIRHDAHQLAAQFTIHCKDEEKKLSMVCNWEHIK